MKGIILAGGLGSRLRPVTHVLNKNLLPIYNKPAIFYSIELFRDAGIKDLCIIAEYKYIEDFKSLLGTGADFEVSLHYENDSVLKKGPASALYHAKGFVGSDSATVVFADGIYDVNIREEVASFTNGAQVFLKEVDNPTRFGVYQLDEVGDVISIEEKPKNPKSNLVFTGLDIYDNKVFDIIRDMPPALDGEYYTTDIDKIYLKKGKLKASVLNGFWRDMGTFNGLFEASEYWYKKNKNCTD